MNADIKWEPDGQGLHPDAAAIVAENNYTVHLRLSAERRQPVTACSAINSIAGLGEFWSGKVDEVTCSACLEHRCSECGCLIRYGSRCRTCGEAALGIAEREVGQSPEDARPVLRDIVIATLSRAKADMAQVGIDQIVAEAVDQIERVLPPGSGDVPTKREACGAGGPREATSDCVRATDHTGEHRDASGGTWPVAEAPTPGK